MNGEPSVPIVADEFAFGAVVARVQEIYHAVMVADFSTDFFLGVAFLFVSVWFLWALLARKREPRAEWRDSLYGKDQPLSSIASRARQIRRERDEKTARHAAAHGVIPPAE